MAGAVALGYLLGAGVVAVRLRRQVAPDQVVGVIGELSRETMITLGFIEGFSVAAAVGLLFGLATAIINRPWKRVRASMIYVPMWIFAAGCFAFIVYHLDGWRAELWILVPLVVMLWAAAILGGRLLAAAAKKSRRCRSRPGLTAVVVIAVGIPLCVMFGPIVGFPDARVCLRTTSEPLTGSLIADTVDRVVLIRQTVDEREASNDRTIDSVPSGTRGPAGLREHG